MLARLSSPQGCGAHAEPCAHQTVFDQFHEDEIGHRDSAKEHEVRARESYEA
jgi:hypothetical protein